MRSFILYPDLFNFHTALTYTHIWHHNHTGVINDQIKWKIVAWIQDKYVDKSNIVSTFFIAITFYCMVPLRGSAVSITLYSTTTNRTCTQRQRRGTGYLNRDSARHAIGAGPLQQITMAGRETFCLSGHSDWADKEVKQTLQRLQCRTPSQSPPSALCWQPPLH